MTVQFDFEHYRELYEKISGLEQQIDTLQNHYLHKRQNSPPLSYEASKKLKDDYEAERDKLCNLKSAYEKELDELLGKDFANLPEVCVRPHVHVLCSEKNHLGAEYEVWYQMSDGNFLSEDRSIQDMYGCGIELITPYDYVGRVLIGKCEGEEYTYIDNGFTTKGVILKIR